MSSAVRRSPAPLTWGTTLALGLISALGPLSTDLHLPALPDVSHQLEASSAAAAATVSVCIAGFALGQLIIGGFADKYGRRRPTLVCLVAFTLLSAGCALAPSIEVLLGLRFLLGFFGAGGVVTTRAAVRDHAQGAAAAKLYSQLAMIAMVTPVLAPVLGGQVLRFTSWRGLFWALTAIGAALVVLAAVKMKESLPPERRTPAGHSQVKLLARVARHPGFGQHLLLAVCQGVVLYSYLTMSSLFLQDEYDVSPQGYSLIVAGVGVGMFCSHYVNTTVGPRFGPLNVLTASVCLYFAGCVLLTTAVLTHAPLPFVVAALVFTLPAMSPSMPSNMAIGMVPFGAAAGTAAALLGSAQQVAGSVVPSIAAQIGTNGAVMVLAMLAGATVALAQVWLVVRPALLRGPRPVFSH